MPIYEYTCLDCGSHFEALRRISDADSVIKCKECDSTRTRRQISACFSRVEAVHPGPVPQVALAAQVDRAAHADINLPGGNKNGLLQR